MNRSPIQLAATLVGLGFLVAGIGGFIPGLTTNFDDITFAGHESGAELLGIFQVSVLHNIIHLTFGVAGLAMASSMARLYLVGGGAGYLAVWLYGVVTDNDSGANFVPFNDADDYLHLAAGAAMIVTGLVLGRVPQTGSHAH